MSDAWRCANQTKIVRDASQCGFYAGRCVKFLDLTGPFMLGGGLGNSKNNMARLPGSEDGFNGCLKDLHIDRQLINLAKMVHNNGSISGCPEKRDFCASYPCKNGGRCENGWGSYKCLCKADWTGKNCGTEVGRTFGFKSASELGYKQELSPIQLPWQMGLAMRSDQKSDNYTLLTVKMGNNGETYRIEVRQGIIYYLHGEEVLLTSGLFAVNDGIWHDVQVKWMEDEVWLNIDYGQYEITERSYHTVGGKVVTKITVGDTQNTISHLIGCIRVSLKLKNITKFSKTVTFSECSNWNERLQINGDCL